MIVMNKKPETKSVWTIPQIITSSIAIVSLCFSIWVFVDMHFISRIEVVAGKQIRLFVAFGSELGNEPKPCILMTIMYMNHGGKPITVFDTKLNVKWLQGGEVVLEKEFQTSRELDNFLTPEDVKNQSPVSPVMMLGKSSEVRKYVFVPYGTLTQEEVPKSFDLEIEVYTETKNEWLLKSRYRAENISNIWQDLKSKTNFQGQVINIREIK